MGTSNVELTQFASRLGWTLVHSLWQGAVAAALLGFALAILRGRSAQARYVAALSALALILIAAGITYRLVGPAAVETPSPPGIPQIPVAAPFASRPMAARSQAPETVAMPREHETVAPARGQTRPMRLPRPMIERITAVLEPMLPWLTIAWAAGVLALSLWHAGGWVAAQRMRVLGVRPPGDEVMALARNVAGHIGLRAPVRVAVSVLAQTPMVIGWLRPVVLLPAALVTGLTPGQLEGILAHELAHIRRHDYLVNLFQVLAETLLFYHPAVWWISRRVRLEREQCCDEIAVRACGDRCAYAESLAALAEARLHAALALAAGGSGGKELLARIRRILRQDDEPPTHTGRVALAALMILIAGAVPLSLLNAAPGTQSPSTTQPPAVASTQPAPATQASSPRPTILLVTPGNYFLERALDHLGWELVTVTPNEFQRLDAKARPLAGEVIVFDRWAPKAAPSEPAMYVDAIPPESGVSVEQDAAGHPVEIKNGQDFDWSVNNPILKGMEFRNALFVAEALKLHVPADWRTLASNAEGKFIVAHDAGYKRQIVIAFDVQQSNWPFEPSFPMFLHRAVRWLTNEEPAPAREGSAPPAWNVRADCVLSELVKGERRVLATPSFNLRAGSDIRFVYPGKPPVVIEQQPGEEPGIAAELRADEQSDGRVRVYCRLQQQQGASRKSDGDKGEDALLNAHVQKLLEAQRNLNEFRQMRDEAQHDLDRRRIGLSGPQRYTLEEICRVDPTLLAKVNARNEQQTTYDYLVTKYGANYPQAKEALQLLQIRQRDVEQSVKRFNDEFLIVRNDDRSPWVISKDVSKLQALVERWQKQFDAETAKVNELSHARGSETDQIVKPGEPVAVELADGTRLEVSARPADRPARRESIK